MTYVSICLLLPTFLVFYIKEALVFKEAKSRVQYICEYLIYVLLTNTSVLFILTYCLDKNTGIVESIRNYNSFAFQYIIIGIVTASMLAFFEKLLKKYFIRITIKSHSIKTNKLIKSVLFWTYLVTMALLTMARIFDDYFWVDEAWTINCIKLPILQLIERTASDVHPPLYYLIVRLFYLVLGDSGAVFHFVSIIPVIIILYLCGHYISSKWGRLVAIMLATGCTLLPAAVIYNVEIRMYSWASLFVFISFLKVYNILNNDRWRDYILFMFASLCAAYTHYYALVAVGFLYIFIFAISLYRKKIFKILAISVGTILGYLPWLYIFLETVERTTESWWMTGMTTVKGCVKFLFGNMNIFYIFGVLLIWVIMQEKFNIFSLHRRCNSEEKLVDIKMLDIKKSEIKKISIETLWIFCGLFSCIATIVFGIVISYCVRPLFQEKYIFVFTACVWLILGLCISKLKYKNIFGIGILCYVLYCFIPNYHSVSAIEENRNELLQSFIEEFEPEDNTMILYNLRDVGETFRCYFPSVFVCYQENLENILDYSEYDLYIFWNKFTVEEDMKELVNKYQWLNPEYVASTYISNLRVEVYKIN